MTKEPSRTRTALARNPAVPYLLELHPVKTLEQGPGILLIIRLARIVGAPYGSSRPTATTLPPRLSEAREQCGHSSVEQP